MGNSPLLHGKKDRLRLGSYSPSGCTNRLRLRSYPSLDMSLEELHPYFPSAHGYSRPSSCTSRWLKSEDRDLEDSVVLGMEINSESVWKLTRNGLKMVGAKQENNDLVPGIRLMDE